MDNSQPEPSMEEILASIRRIISDDEAEPAQTTPAATSVPASEPSKPALVEKLAQPAPESHSPPPAETPPAPREPRAEDPARAHLETEDIEMITKNVAAAMGEDAGEAILGTASADAASSAFMSLSETVRVTDGGGRTLEDIVVAMLKPMVKEWLDANLPTIVEEKVEEEVQRVARRRR